MYVLSVQYSCAVVSVFLFSRKANLVLLTLFYSTLLALTDRQTDRKSNTLALRGLEQPFFQLCCCFSFLFWREIGFDFTYYLCTQSTIQLWCCVSFFGSGGKWFLVLHTYLVYNTIVRLCQFFFVAGKLILYKYLTVTIISQKYRELSLYKN